MALIAAPQIQLQILGHQLHTINRKKQQSQIQVLIWYDVAACLLLCTMTILAVTLRKQIVEMAKYQLQQQHQHHPHSRKISTSWHVLQHPSSFFRSLVTGLFHYTASTASGTHPTKSGDTSFTSSSRAAINRPYQVEIKQQELLDNVDTLPPPTLPTKIAEMQESQGDILQVTAEQSNINPVKLNNDHDLAPTTVLNNGIKESANVPITKRRKTYYKYLEILVHNVSHTDLVLGLDLPSEESDIAVPHSTDGTQEIHEGKPSEEQTSQSIDDSIHDDDTFSSPYKKNYIRPRFSSFDLYCRLVLDHVTASNGVENCNKNEINATRSTTIIHFPRYHRSMMDPRYAIQNFQDQITSRKKYVPPKMAPTGIQLSCPIPFPTAAVATSPTLQGHPIEDTIRIRGRDATAILSALKRDSVSSFVPDEGSTPPVDNMVSIKYVFFPLLATLLPVWYRQIKEKQYQEPVKRVIVLVTGVGTPRNFTHSIHGNSTEACADLMKVFLSNIDPSLSVVKVFSDSTNIFRTDENILFCERELMPLINAYRNAHVMGTPYPDDEDYVPILDETSVYFDDDNESDWRTRLHVTLSFADGSPARTQAIQSSLRSYKPTYFHFWQLKTFWHESKIVDDDIEVHSFATMESIPAIDTAEIRDPYIQAVVAEMRAFYDEMIEALNNKDNDIDRFWLRKSHKPVLAVLLVQPSVSVPIYGRTDGHSVPSFRLYRGTNMEVSMPTGSLCAERNAIGSALAMNPNLKRHDLKMIAVLAVPPLEPGPTNMLASTDNSTGDQTDAVQALTIGKSAYLGDSSTRITGDNIRRITSYSSILVESIDANDDDDDDDLNNRSSQTSIDERSYDHYIRKSSIGSDYEPITTISTSTTAARDESATIYESINSSLCFPVGIVHSGEDGIRTRQNDPKSSSTAFNCRNPTEPIRRIPLFPKAPSTIITTESLSEKVPKLTAGTSVPTTDKTVPGRMQQKTKRTVVVQSHKDQNPLSPCGACNEWIKKIAQCNPYFKIITFTDANCNGMYISSCQD